MRKVVLQTGLQGAAEYDAVGSAHVHRTDDVQQLLAGR